MLPDRHMHMHTLRSCGTVALEAEVNISKYQRMREVSVRQL